MDEITWDDLCGLRDPLAVFVWIRRALDGKAIIRNIPMIPKTDELDLVARAIRDTPENEAQIRGCE
jgi:hypothetical protein